MTAQTLRPTAIPAARAVAVVGVTLTLVVVGALLLSRGSTPSPHYALTSQTRACLAPIVLLDPTSLDAFAQAAPGGGLYARFNQSTAVEVSYAADASAAQAEARQYAAFGPSLVERLGNVVLAWDGRPTADEAAGIRRCIGA